MWHQTEKKVTRNTKNGINDEKTGILILQIVTTLSVHIRG